MIQSARTRGVLAPVVTPFKADLSRLATSWKLDLLLNAMHHRHRSD